MCLRLAQQSTFIAFLVQWWLSPSEGSTALFWYFHNTLHGAWTLFSPDGKIFGLAVLIFLWRAPFSPPLHSSQLPQYTQQPKKTETTTPETTPELYHVVWAPAHQSSCFLLLESRTRQRRVGPRLALERCTLFPELPLPHSWADWDLGLLCRSIVLTQQHQGPGLS